MSSTYVHFHLYTSDKGGEYAILAAKSKGNVRQKIVKHTVSDIAIFHNHLQIPQPVRQQT